jgi:hypothetical protein
MVETAKMIQAQYGINSEVVYGLQWVAAIDRVYVFAVSKLVEDCSMRYQMKRKTTKLSHHDVPRPAHGPKWISPFEATGLVAGPFVPP